MNCKMKLEEPLTILEFPDVTILPKLKEVISVKLNSQSVTIKTEKTLYPIWMEVLTNIMESPIDSGPKGN